MDANSQFWIHSYLCVCPTGRLDGTTQHRERRSVGERGEAKTALELEGESAADGARHLHEVSLAGGQLKRPRVIVEEVSHIE